MELNTDVSSFRHVIIALISNLKPRTSVVVAVCALSVQLKLRYGNRAGVLMDSRQGAHACMRIPVMLCYIRG